MVIYWMNGDAQHGKPTTYDILLINWKSKYCKTKLKYIIKLHNTFNFIKKTKVTYLIGN